MSQRWMWRRLTLRRTDGDVYLDRWGFFTPFGGILLHKMTAPDPGLDLHDHPWPFASVILRGGYTEIRQTIRDFYEGTAPHYQSWKAGTVHVIRMDECHTIRRLLRVPTWTLVFTGRKGRTWGFYERPTGRFAAHREYATERRQVYAERDNRA